LRKDFYLHLRGLKIIRSFGSSRTGQPASSKRWKLFANSKGIIWEKTLISINKKVSTWNNAENRVQENRYKLPGGPPFRKRDQELSMHYMLLYFPAESDVIRWWFNKALIIRPNSTYRSSTILLLLYITTCKDLSCWQHLRPAAILARTSIFIFSFPGFWNDSQTYYQQVHNSVYYVF
jgi:hypothetical protein